MTSTTTTTTTTTTTPNHHVLPPFASKEFDEEIERITEEVNRALDVDERIASAEDAFESACADNERLRELVADAKRERTEMEGEIIPLKARIEELRGEIVDLKTELREIEARNKSESTEIARRMTESLANERLANERFRERAIVELEKADDEIRELRKQLRRERMGGDLPEKEKERTSADVSPPPKRLRLSDDVTDDTDVVTSSTSVSPDVVVVPETPPPTNEFEGDVAFSEEEETTWEDTPRGTDETNIKKYVHVFADGENVSSEVPPKVRRKISKVYAELRARDPDETTVKRFLAGFRDLTLYVGRIRACFTFHRFDARHFTSLKAFLQEYERFRRSERDDSTTSNTETTLLVTEERESSCREEEKGDVFVDEEATTLEYFFRDGDSHLSFPHRFRQRIYHVFVKLKAVDPDEDELRRFLEGYDRVAMNERRDEKTGYLKVYSTIYDVDGRTVSSADKLAEIYRTRRRRRDDETETASAEVETTPIAAHFPETALTHEREEVADGYRDVVATTRRTTEKYVHVFAAGEVPPPTSCTHRVRRKIAGVYTELRAYDADEETLNRFLQKFSDMTIRMSEKKTQYAFHYVDGGATNTLRAFLDEYERFSQSNAKPDDGRRGGRHPPTHDADGSQDDEAETTGDDDIEGKSDDAPKLDKYVHAFAGDDETVSSEFPPEIRWKISDFYAELRARDPDETTVKRFLAGFRDLTLYVDSVRTRYLFHRFDGRHFTSLKAVLQEFDRFGREPTPLKVTKFDSPPSSDETTEEEEEKEEKTKDDENENPPPHPPPAEKTTEENESSPTPPPPPTHPPPAKTTLSSDGTTCEYFFVDGDAHISLPYSFRIRVSNTLDKLKKVNSDESTLRRFLLDFDRISMNQRPAGPGRTGIVDAVIYDKNKRKITSSEKMAERYRDFCSDETKRDDVDAKKEDDRVKYFHVFADGDVPNSSFPEYVRRRIVDTYDELRLQNPDETKLRRFLAGFHQLAIYAAKNRNTSSYYQVFDFDGKRVFDSLKSFRRAYGEWCWKEDV